MKLKGGIAFAIISIGLAVGAWATPWYTIIATLGSSSSTIKFYWTNYITTDSNGDSKTLKYTHEDTLGAPDLPTVASTFSNCLAFITAGAACMIATVVYQGARVLFKVGKGSGVCRIIGNLISTAGVALLAVSFFSFLNITKAFLTDEWPACKPLLTTDYNHYNCISLMGSNPQDNGILPDSNYEWKPEIGWWLLLGSLAAAIFSAIGVLASKRG